MILDKNKHKILIVGLGLMGGSYAKALSKAGYEVYAITKNQEDIDYALSLGIIKEGSSEVSESLIERCGIIIFALYPKILIEWIKEHGKKIKAGTVITDVSGVKSGIVDTVQSLLPNGVEFISAHPMAGRELSGIQYSDESVFKNANYIVVPTEKNTAAATELCCDIGHALGFANISTLSAAEHDKMIAFLSQLTHVIAVSLMCANDDMSLNKYTGDSFRDLTRIAKINEVMWSELFMLNKDALLKEMESFEKSFEKFKNALINDDCDAMKKMMIESTKRRKGFDK